MASPRIFGRACIYSMDGTQIYLYGYASTAGYSLQNAAFNDLFTLAPLYSADGDTKGMKVCDLRATAVIEMIPIGGAGNRISEASTGVQLPPPMSLVRLINFPGAVGGYWNYAGNGSFRMARDQIAAIILPLVRFSSIDPRALSPISIKR